MSLGEALDRVGTLYRKEGRAKVDAKSAVAAWGYGSLNGASLRVLSALRQYGLVEGGNEDVKVSERSLTILLEPETSPEYAEALNASLMAPALFREIMAEYGNDLPSDPALISYLVRKQGFGEQAAKALIESFRESVELVRERTASYNGLMAEHNARSVRPTEEPAITLPAREIEPAKSAGARTFTYTLSGDTVVTVSITGRFPSPKNVGRLLRWLDILKEEIEEAAAEAAEEAATALADVSILP
jgi:hypothetical protein